MKIVVTGGKGGVGKSMVATSLSFQLAKEKKVMLIDCDVECPNDHILLSIKRKRYKVLYQMVPKLDKRKCRKCGACARVCKQNAIVAVEGKYPFFVKDVCIGCGACIIACPFGAISKSKKEIGKVFVGKNYNVFLVSGELKVGELASGEVVSQLREIAQEIDKKIKSDFVIIDSPPGIGCPVIASIRGTDFVIGVTEPSPTALSDLKRVLFLAQKFKIKAAIIINKFDLAKNFSRKIENFAKRKGLSVLGKIPFSKDFINCTIKQKPVFEIKKNYQAIFSRIVQNLKKSWKKSS